MLLIFQIVFTVLSALSVAAVLIVGALVGWAWAGFCIVLALLFFGAALLCKQSLAMKRPKEENEANDFLSAKSKTEENEQKSQRP